MKQFSVLILETINLVQKPGELGNHTKERYICLAIDRVLWVDSGLRQAFRKRINARLGYYTFAVWLFKNKGGRDYPLPGYVQACRHAWLEDMYREANGQPSLPLAKGLLIPARPTPKGSHEEI